MANNFWSGQGGHFKVGAAVNLPVAEWRLKKSARLAEVTTSTSTSVRRANILPDGQFTISFPWDLDQTPDSIGLTEGASLADIRLRLGNSGQRYGPFAGIVEDVEIIEDVAKDVIRCQVTGYAQQAIGSPVADV